MFYPCMLTSASKMYIDPDCKPWTSRSWAPKGFASRADLAEKHRAAEAKEPYVAEAELEEGRFGNEKTNNGVNTEGEESTSANESSKLDV